MSFGRRRVGSDMGRRIGSSLATLALGALGAACGNDKPAETPPLPGGPASGVAVMMTDFASTSISLLARDGTLAKDDCIDSGTQACGKLSLALSVDVTLPSQPQMCGALWIIDSGIAAFTIVAPTSCTVRGQVSVSKAFKSNPHDVAVLSDKKVYVTF